MAHTRAGMLDVMQAYFRCVDTKDIEGLMALLTEDCLVRIESEQLEHRGRDTGVRGMFERLFATYARIWHGDFRWVIDTEAGIIACQLTVINTSPDGTEHHKYNSSFYHLRGNRISYAGIYMSGRNALV